MKHLFPRRRVALMLGFALSAPALWAQPVPAAWHYVDVATLDFQAILPPPPEPGSLAAQADMETVQRAQLMRGAADTEWARSADRSLRTFMEPAVTGDWFNEKNLPFTAGFLGEIQQDTDAVIRKTKALFARLRPPFVDATIKPCVPLSKSYSYPSGHATRAYVWAGVLSDIFPERREEFEAYASKIAWGRIIGGVHFPTDLTAGRRAAEAMLKELQKWPQYQEAVKKAGLEAGAFLKKNAASAASL